ncbi:MAG: hypothetical protein P8R42_11340 [Candidatus Binatia bacterium]|nr:hypothetical protein [Candidatus Binatia bacterium]
MTEAVPTNRKPLLFGALLAVAGLSAALVLGWSQAIWPLNQASSKALSRRVQQFWDLKTAGDVLGAYSYMSEAYRRRVAPAGLGREGQGLVIHTGAKVQEIEIEGQTATVLLALKHRFNKRHFADMETISPVEERWVFENGAWYRWPFGIRG